MPSKNIEISVGLLMVAGLAALIFLAVQVSGLSDFYTQQNGFTLHAYFENIGGLKKRAKVSIGGVEIGRVANIKLNTDDFSAKVTMRIYDKFAKIPNDSKASILTAGLLGDNYIGLEPGFSEDYLLDNHIIELENTSKAVILEDLLSRLLVSEPK